MISFHVLFSFVISILSKDREKDSWFSTEKEIATKDWLTDLVKSKKSCYNWKDGGVMALKKASLACTVCGSRNYSIKLSSTPKPKRLEVNKYCKHCSKYTIHKETR